LVGKGSDWRRRGCWWMVVPKTRREGYRLLLFPIYNCYSITLMVRSLALYLWLRNVLHSSMILVILLSHSIKHPPSASYSRAIKPAHPTISLRFSSLLSPSHLIETHFRFPRSHISQNITQPHAFTFLNQPLWATLY
jgi:hypothetical protein